MTNCTGDVWKGKYKCYQKWAWENNSFLGDLIDRG